MGNTLKDAKLVWSDEEGDLRKKKGAPDAQEEVDESILVLCLRRLTTGKGRTVIEITGLPNNKKWCQKLSKTIKKKLGVGGSYKNGIIEVHGEKLPEVSELLESSSLKFKKVGG